MDESNEQDKKFKQMTETPVARLITRLAIPSIIGMLITSCYNIADTYFVSKLGTSASAAVGVVFSMMAMIQAVGFSVGQGVGNYASRMLGAKNPDEAKRVLATGFFTVLIIGVLFAIVGITFSDELVVLLGATETVVPYARAYARYILIGAPYMMAAFVLNITLRCQGNSMLSMIGIGVGGLLNIALDPLFIFTFDMGTAGAALATIISQFVSFAILFAIINSRRSTVKINPKYFTPRLYLYKEIIRIGIPSFYRQGLASISTVIMNRFASPYGDAAIAAMSIVARVYQFLYAGVIGFGQGYQPVCGYNYGAKRNDRIVDAYKFCVKVATVVFSVMGAAAFIFAPEILALFRKSDAAVIEIGALALRMHCCVLPLLGWTVVSNMTCQCLGKSFYASLMSLSQNGLFFIPYIIILSRAFGIIGVQISMPLGNLSAFVMSLFIGKKVLKELRSQECSPPRLN